MKTNQMFCFKKLTILFFVFKPSTTNVAHTQHTVNKIFVFLVALMLPFSIVYRIPAPAYNQYSWPLYVFKPYYGPIL